MSDITASSALERDARVINTHNSHVNPADIAIGVVIGRAAEFFDFFVFAIACVLVFPAHVFPFAEPVTGTLYSFLVLSLAFIARPFGTWLFMTIDRHFGKGAKLTIALFLLACSTIVIAFVPSYERIGSLAIVLLCVFRIGQGLALGGTWDGLASLLSMNAPRGQHGWYAMVPQLGAPIGLIVASGLFAFFVGTLSTEDFQAWGWQFPFFVAFAINVVALFARLRIVVTPEYTRQYQNRELQASRVRRTVRSQGRFILIGAFAPLASFALFHMVTVFPLSWIYLFTPQSATRFLLIQVAAAVVGIISIVLSGVLADRFGRRKLLGGTAILIGIFSGIAPLLLDGGEAGELAYMVLGFALLGLSFGQCSGAVASNFPRTFRYTGSAITSDLAWLFGAGFAPFVALLLSSYFGLIASGLYLLSGAICTLVALLINRRFEISED